MACLPTYKGKRYNSLEEIKSVIQKEYSSQPLLVNTMRTSNKEAEYAHFGNPFSESGYAGTIKMPSVEAAVQAYKDWLLTDKYSGQIQDIKIKDEIINLYKELVRVEDIPFETVKKAELINKQGERERSLAAQIAEKEIMNDGLSHFERREIFGDRYRDRLVQMIEDEKDRIRYKIIGKLLDEKKIKSVLPEVFRIGELSEYDLSFYKKYTGKKYAGLFNEPVYVTKNNVLLGTKSNVVSAFAKYTKQRNKKEIVSKSVNPQQRQWILEQINSGKLDNATLLSSKEESTHAHALAEVIEELRGKQQTTTSQPTKNDENTKLYQESGRQLEKLSNEKIKNLESTVKYSFIKKSENENLEIKGGQSYFYLNEKEGERFNKVIKNNKGFPEEFKITRKITKYEKDVNVTLKYNSYNEYKDFYLVKTNKNKKSNLYDIVDKETGEIIFSKIRVLTESKNVKAEIAKNFGLEFKPTKVFNINRSIAFTLYREKPSKAKYIAQAKRYLYEALKFLNKEETSLKINLDQIEQFLDKFPEEMWDFINTTYSPEDDTSINASIKLRNSIKFNLPKRGLLEAIEKITNIKLEGVSFKNYDRNGSLAKIFKYSQIKGDWGDTITIDPSKLTTRELRASISYFLKTKKYFKESSEEKNVRKYAEHKKIEYEKLKELVFGNIDNALEHVLYNMSGNSDTIEISKWRESIKNYDWQSVELFEKPYTDFEEKVIKRINDKFKDRKLINGLSHLDYFFSGNFNWLNINFNNISGEYYQSDMETSAPVGFTDKTLGFRSPFEMRFYQKPKAGEHFLKEKEVFNRLAAVLHEPTHALHALAYGTKEEKELRKSFYTLYETDFGRKMLDQIFGEMYNNKEVSYDTLYKETIAFMTQLMLYPKEWINKTDLRSNDIYEFIEKVQTLQDKTYKEIVKTRQKVGTVETIVNKEEKIKLNFLEKLYNYLITVLNKVIPLSKKFFKLIKNSKIVKETVIEDVFGTVEEEVTKTKKLPENIKRKKKEFLDAMEELKVSINNLMEIDGELFSSQNVQNFFSTENFAQEEKRNKKPTDEDSMTSDTTPEQQIELTKKLQDKLQKLYPEIKLNITNNPEWEQDDNVFNQKEYSNQVNYRLKAINILLSDKAKQIFEKGKKNGWNLNKILTELQVPKEQKKIILDKNINNREEIITSLLADNSFVVEVNTATKVKKEYRTHDRFILNGDSFTKIDTYRKNGDKISKEEYNSAIKEYDKTNPLKTVNADYYSNLTVPGGINYTENEIATPDITPSIKGHAAFSTDNGIGWFRSDDKIINGKWSRRDVGNEFIEIIEAKTIGGDITKTRRILEVQSDLFQKGKDKKYLLPIIEVRPDVSDKIVLNKINQKIEEDDTGFGIGNEITINNIIYERNITNGKWRYKNFQKVRGDETQNQFLQLLNKKSNWVTFFIKSIIQDSAKKGYEKVLFPKGDTAAKIEGHETLANEIKKWDDNIKLLQDAKNNPDKYKIIESDIDEETGKYIQYETYSIELSEGRGSYSVSNKKDFISGIDKQIEESKRQKQELKSQGIEKLKPIEAFYENRITNILKKNDYNPVEITDEYGNKWNEIEITPEVLSDILLQRNEANKIIGQANIKAATVLIDAINQKQDTLPHEYAHHYIAWFRNTPIVQEAIKKWGSEEALVQSIGEQAVKQKGEAWNWWNKFVKWIMNKFNSLSNLQKEELTQILTDAFLTRQNLSQINSKNIKKGVAELFESKISKELETKIKSTTISDELKAFIEYQVLGKSAPQRTEPWGEIVTLRPYSKGKVFSQHRFENLRTVIFAHLADRYKRGKTKEYKTLLNILKEIFPTLSENDIFRAANLAWAIEEAKFDARSDEVAEAERIAMSGRLIPTNLEDWEERLKKFNFDKYLKDAPFKVVNFKKLKDSKNNLLENIQYGLNSDEWNNLTEEEKNTIRWQNKNCK